MSLCLAAMVVKFSEVGRLFGTAAKAAPSAAVMLLSWLEITAEEGIHIHHTSHLASFPSYFSN